VATDNIGMRRNQPNEDQLLGLTSKEALGLVVYAADLKVKPFKRLDDDEVSET